MVQGLLELRAFGRLGPLGHKAVKALGHEALKASGTWASLKFLWGPGQKTRLLPKKPTKTMQIKDSKTFTYLNSTSQIWHPAILPRTKGGETNKHIIRVLPFYDVRHRKHEFV